MDFYINFLQTPGIYLLKNNFDNKKSYFNNFHSFKNITKSLIF